MDGLSDESGSETSECPSRMSLDSTSTLGIGPSVANTAGVVVTVHATNAKRLPKPTKLEWQTRLHDRVTASVSLDACYGIPPHLLFDLLSDPRTHASIFDAIQVSQQVLERKQPGILCMLYQCQEPVAFVGSVLDSRVFPIAYIDVRSNMSNAYSTTL